MIGLGRIRSDEERAAKSARLSAAAVQRHARERSRALVEMLRWPNGLTAMPGLPETVLRALGARGLAERRWVLTPQGRRQAETLKVETEQP